MKVNINNKPTEVESQQLLSLAAELSLPEKGVAVAVNNRMVPRTDWDKTTVNEGDNILIIKAVCGG